MDAVLNFVLTHGAEIAGAVLAILGGFSVLAKFTPTDADDKVLAAILKVVHTLGLTKVK